MIDGTSNSTQNITPFGNSAARSTQTKQKRSSTFLDQLSKAAERSGTTSAAGVRPTSAQKSSQGETSSQVQKVATAVAITPAPASPVDVLKNKLAELGISSAGLTFTEQRWTVNNPGRTWENHCVTVDFGNGVRENYDVDLMMRNPQVSAVEVAYTRRALGLA